MIKLYEGDDKKSCPDDYLENSFKEDCNLSQSVINESIGEESDHSNSNCKIKMRKRLPVLILKEIIRTEINPETEMKEY